MVANGWLNIPTANKFASIYRGSVTVSKAEGGDNWYTFKIDGIDVVKHKVTGSWTGRSTSEARTRPSSGPELPCRRPQKQRALSLREVKSHIADQQSVLPKRHTYNK